MTAYYSDDWLTIHEGDCREVMASMEPESVHCVVTSPPYWGLRDYGTATWVGGDEGCDHSPLGAPRATRPASGLTGGKATVDAGTVASGDCRRCGAIRQDSQLGLEPTPEAYVESMVAVFREVRRVLRADGTVWLNLGDSYANTSAGSAYGWTNGKTSEHDAATMAAYRSPGLPSGLKPKDLVGIPWRVAFALQQPYYTGQIKDERDRTWLAALMDGEGTFTILSTTSSSAGSVSYPPIAQVRMTSAGVVAKAASLVGVMSPAQYPPSGGGNRAVYQWRLAGGRAASVARELYPYLIEKRRQAMVAWNHQQIREGYETKRGVGMPAEARAKQVLCRDIIRRLNRGEHVDLPSWMIEPPSMMEPGWYLRSDVIWAKPNPMPESVTDRPTKAHEYLFLLSKSPRYYYDADAVREPAEYGRREWTDVAGIMATVGLGGTKGKGTVRGSDPSAGRNLRSVWSIATQPYPGAHFATFPEKLVEPCILAGTSAKGVCPECGAPWARETSVEYRSSTYGDSLRADAPESNDQKGRRGEFQTKGFAERMRKDVTTTGWHPTCSHVLQYHPHVPLDPVPATVLDPFAGSGTTARVAARLSRRAVLIDLNADYLRQAMKRNTDIPLGMETA